MKPPADLSAPAQALWRATERELKARGPIRAVDWPAIERFVRAHDLARRAWEQLPDELTVIGSHGQEMAHPMIRSALAAETAAARFGAELGIVRAAKRVGRPVGAVSAPDRAAPARLTRVA